MIMEGRRGTPGDTHIYTHIDSKLTRLTYEERLETHFFKTII